MDLILIKQPYVVSFSGNPVAFTFAVTPYRSAEAALDLKILIWVQTEGDPGSTIFITAKEFFLNVSTDGTATTNIQAILKSFVTQYIPPLNQTIPSVMPDQAKSFRIVYRLLNNNQLVDGSIQTSESYVVVKGGMAYEQWHPRKYFDALIDNKTFLRYQVKRELVFPDERKYLSWLYPYADGLLQYLQYDIGLDDGTIISGPPIINQITDEYIYKENAEWLGFSNAAGADFVYTDDPHSGSLSINIPSFTDGQYLYFTAPSSVNITDYKYLRFYVKIRSVYINSTDFVITFLNAGLSITLPLNSISFGFNQALIDQWQEIIIPLESLVKTGSQFDTLYFKLNYGNDQGFQIDDIILLAPRGDLSLNCLQWQECITPAGFNQLGLDKLVPNGNTAVWYAINIVNQDDIPICFPQKFYLDYRTFYDTKDLLYSNSVGGIETIRLRGQIDANADYERINADKAKVPDYLSQGILDGTTESVYASELESFKGDTGFLKRDELLRLRDLYLPKKGVYEIKNNRLLPVVLVNKNASWWNNKQKLYSNTIEWQYAFANDYFTPDNTINAIQDCPALESFRISQSGGSKLTVIWAMEFGYKKLSVEITIGQDIYEYLLIGNTGQKEIVFPNPLAAGQSTVITVVGRTICNDLALPADLGPATTINLTIYGNLAPYGQYDYPEVNQLNTEFELPGSVLDNDYDLNGDEISVVPASGVTSMGGFYSITADGKVTYTSPSYYGADEFPYTITDGILTSQLLVIISVNPPTGNPSILTYVKISIRQTSAVASGSLVTSYGQIWLEFYSNAAGSNPIDVTGLGLVINYRKTYDDDQPGVVNTDSSVTGNGFETKIYDGAISQAKVDLLFKMIYTNSWSVLPGAGYKAI